MRAKTIKIVLIAAMIDLWTSCGAPNKSAADVSAMFDAPALTIQEKVMTVCQILRARTNKPTTQGIGLAILDNCEGAGDHAVDLDTMTGLETQKLSPSTGDTDPAMRSSLRMQLWFNKPLLGLASLVKNINKFKEVGDNLPIDLKDAIKAKTKITTDLNLDLEKEIAGSVAVDVMTEGVVKIDLTMQISFMVFGKGIAMVIDTPRAEGVIKDVMAVVLIIPHAGDTYLDAILSFKLAKLLEDTKVVDAMTPKVIELILCMFFDINLDQRKAEVDNGSATTLRLFKEGSSGV